MPHWLLRASGSGHQRRRERLLQGLLGWIGLLLPATLRLSNGLLTVRRLTVGRRRWLWRRGRRSDGLWLLWPAALGRGLLLLCWRLRSGGRRLRGRAGRGRLIRPGDVAPCLHLGQIGRSRLGLKLYARDEHDRPARPELHTRAGLNFHRVCNPTAIQESAEA